MFNAIVRSALANRLMVLAGAFLLLVYGGMTAYRTPVDVFPDLNKPLVTVITEAGGIVGNFEGESDYLHKGNVIAGTPKIFAQMVALLKPLS